MDNTAELNVIELDKQIATLHASRCKQAASLLREKYLRKYFKVVSRRNEELHTELIFVAYVDDNAVIGGMRYCVTQGISGKIQCMFIDDRFSEFNIKHENYEYSEELTREVFTMELNQFLGYLGLMSNLTIKATAE